MFALLLVSQFVALGGLAAAPVASELREPKAASLADWSQRQVNRNNDRNLVDVRNGVFGHLTFEACTDCSILLPRVRLSTADSGQAPAVRTRAISTEGETCTEELGCTEPPFSNAWNCTTDALCTQAQGCTGSSHCSAAINCTQQGTCSAIGTCTEGARCSSGSNCTAVGSECSKGGTCTAAHGGPLCSTGGGCTSGPACPTNVDTCGTSEDDTSPDRHGTGTRGQWGALVLTAILGLGLVSLSRRELFHHFTRG